MIGSNMNRRVIGSCSQCGGVVSIPTVLHSVNRPVPACEACGACADVTAGLPVVPTTPVRAAPPPLRPRARHPYFNGLQSPRGAGRE